MSRQLLSPYDYMENGVWTEASYNNYMQAVIRQEGMTAAAQSIGSEPKKFSLTKAPMVGQPYKGGPVGMVGQLSPNLGFPGTLRRG
jgi:hypothetical protein